jgi:hypothetical protein
LLQFPGVAAARQHRANFRSAFSAFQFVRIRAIRVKPPRLCSAISQLRRVPRRFYPPRPRPRPRFLGLSITITRTTTRRIWLRLEPRYVSALKNRRNPRSNHFSQLILISFSMDLNSVSAVTGS